jgi:hypothetical protein
MFEPFPLGLGGDDGVTDMESLSVIRRWHYRDHFSIREISRRTGLSRNTVRKYVRSETVERSSTSLIARASRTLVVGVSDGEQPRHCLTGTWTSLWTAAAGSA